jgi:NAD(P)-dependent dehydrogenase (short-subunit alcohol dehydrogenase family)
MNAVLITGACGGIGVELVRAYYEAGYQVIAMDSEPRVSSLSDVDFLQFDLTSLVMNNSARGHIREEVQRLLGTNSLKALINNAAVQIVKPFEEINLEDWKVTLDVNLLAPFFCSQIFFDLLENSKGSILNISSIHASQTKKGFSAYATSKAALSSLTRLLAIELGSRVRVNAIEPGAISTQMLESGFKNHSELRHALDNLQPMKRIGKPEEVAKLALFLTSEDAQFINGAAMAIDGGIRNQLHDPV